MIRMVMLGFTSKTKKRMMILLSMILLLVAAKACWVKCETAGHGSFDNEKKDLIHRANYLRQHWQILQSFIPRIRNYPLSS